MREERADVVVIGSGFGGSMAAVPLVGAGLDVLMLERGNWVPPGPGHWSTARLRELPPYYPAASTYRTRGVLRAGSARAYYCVGGPSVFFAGVASRFREPDFEPAEEIVADSAAEWPYRYRDLEPFYSQAESLLDVAGRVGEDPTEPPRSRPYPQDAPELAAPSRRLADAALRLGLQPFRLPLAINYRRQDGRAPCACCPHCDGFPCHVGAKNDVASAIVPRLLRAGLRLRPCTIALRLLPDGDRVLAVEAFDRMRGERVRFLAGTFVLAAGALASAHLLLASGLERRNPGGRIIGRYLMRHCNAHVFGVFPSRVDPEDRFHKQIGIHDFYFGDDGHGAPQGKLGSMQQMATPKVALALLPAPVNRWLAPMVDRLTGLLVIAEDQPRWENRVTIERARLGPDGLPPLFIEHRYSGRDLAARRALMRCARSILFGAGAPIQVPYRIRTFSHAVGTVRMGSDSAHSALDEWCRFRGLDNLFVTDGSVMPTSAGVNPSLTISANALRTGDYLARSFASVSRRAGNTGGQPGRREEP
ncbi:MAG: GMC family oxidoreductase [Gemmatimonadetes bacterium]|nr:GMC family oxidoreductase [Gemmatimonadota bacterium]